MKDWKVSNQIILRHDVDLDIGAAQRLSEIEFEYGVRSTFCFLTSSSTYNILERENRRIIREMSKRGFEVGLHFDPGVYDEAAEAMLEHVRREAVLLSDVIDLPVVSISLHNPSVRGEYQLFEGYINAYDPIIFARDRYISDSRMLLTQDDLLRFVKTAGNVPLQILLHPLHYTEHGATYLDIFSAFLQGCAVILHDTFKVNSTYVNLIESTGDGLFTYICRSNLR
jgi:hypothetical protein